MVLVRITDTAWLEDPSLPAQSTQHEATKAQLTAAQEAAEKLRAEYEAACAAQDEAVKERGQLEKRVRRVGGPRCGHTAWRLPALRLGPCLPHLHLVRPRALSCSAVH